MYKKILLSLSSKLDSIDNSRSIQAVVSTLETRKLKLSAIIMLLAIVIMQQLIIGIFNITLNILSGFQLNKWTRIDTLNEIDDIAKAVHNMFKDNMNYQGA